MNVSFSNSSSVLSEQDSTICQLAIAEKIEQLQPDHKMLCDDLIQYKQKMAKRIADLDSNIAKALPTAQAAQQSFAQFQTLQQQLAQIEKEQAEKSKELTAASALQLEASQLNNRVKVKEMITLSNTITERMSVLDTDHAQKTMELSAMKENFTQWNNDVKAYEALIKKKEALAAKVYNEIRKGEFWIEIQKKMQSGLNSGIQVLGQAAARSSHSNNSNNNSSNAASSFHTGRTSMVLPSLSNSNSSNSNSSTAMEDESSNSSNSNSSTAMKDQPSSKSSTISKSSTGMEITSSNSNSSNSNSSTASSGKKRSRDEVKNASTDRPEKQQKKEEVSKQEKAEEVSKQQKEEDLKAVAEYGPLDSYPIVPSKDDFAGHPLHHFIASGNLTKETLSKFLQNEENLKELNTPVRGWRPVQLLVMKGTPSVLKLFLKKCKPELDCTVTGLNDLQWNLLNLIACSKAMNVESVAKILDRIPITIPKQPEKLMPLHIAAHFGHRHTFGALINTEKFPDIDALDATGRAPIHWASMSFGGHEAVKLLIALKANSNKRDSATSRNPMHFAANYCAANTVELLLRNNPELNARDKDGKKPLDYVRNPWFAGKIPANADGRIVLEQRLIANGAESASWKKK